MIDKNIIPAYDDEMERGKIITEIKRGCPLTEMGASFQIKLRYQNPQKQVVKLLAVFYAESKNMCSQNLAQVMNQCEQIVFR